MFSKYIQLIDDVLTIVYFAFSSKLISLVGAEVLPLNPRLGFPGGLSNLFWAKIGFGIQWRYSGGLKVPGTPLNFRFLVLIFHILVDLQ